MAGGSKGIGAGLKIDSSLDVLTNVSSWMRASSGDSDPDILDDTTWQPDEPAPTKSEIAGFRSYSRQLTVLYSAASWAFFNAIQGTNGLDYEFAPLGFTAGNPKIYGKCNCLAVSEPSPATNNVLEFTVRFTLTSRLVTTY